MASYAAIASSAAAAISPVVVAANASSTVVSPSYSRGVITELQKEIRDALAFLHASGGDVADSLLLTINNLRGDMEIPQTSHAARQGNRFGGGGGGGGTPPHSQDGRNFSQASASSWRNLPATSSPSATNAAGGGGGRFGGGSNSQATSSDKSKGNFDTRNTDSFGVSRSNVRGSTTAGTSSASASASAHRAPPAGQPRPNPGRYQSKFTSGGDLNDKILNTVIGNKLNAFTPLTYNDTRDFIYQIMDSGETEFVKDFIEKVFTKATVEELYCALFAKLIAEIAHRYPIMYEEMKRYHSEFLKVFEDVHESGEGSSEKIIKQRQYRLGYGQFISELASLNALEKSQLLAMVEKVMEKIWSLTAQEDKTKTVEEFIDCLIRLTKSLADKSPKFFVLVKNDIKMRIIDQVTGLINKTAGPRPSLSSKSRFGLMDLKDIL